MSLASGMSVVVVMYVVGGALGQSAVSQSASRCSGGLSVVRVHTCKRTVAGLGCHGQCLSKSISNAYKGP